METATPTAKRHGLDHPNQVAALQQSEREASVSARITDCVSRAFLAIGASSETQEILFWNIYMTKNIGRNEIMNKPTEFIEGVRDIYGQAGTVVFEYMLSREIKREFGLSGAFDEEPLKARSLADLLHLIAYAAREE